MRAIRWIASAAAVLGAAALVAAPSASAASAHCTAYGALPAHVSMHSDRVVVHVVLRGSSACHGEMTDNGASAYLHRPGHPKEALRWRKFGSSQRVELYINLDHTGRYAVNSGDVQVYDNRYEQVDSSWRTTAMIVKHGARITHASAGGSTVTGWVQDYSKFGWAAYAHAKVYVQRRAVGSSTWHALGSTHADAQGRVSFHTVTSSNSVYRLSVHRTSSIWGAGSTGVQG
jgi:hypothetical protein